MFLLRRQDGGAGTDLRTGSEERTRSGRVRVRCPRCGWEPGRDARWACLCGHVWNTFDTGGVCPACERAWSETQCLRCHRWSRHEDWYVDEEGGGPEG